MKKRVRERESERTGVIVFQTLIHSERERWRVKERDREWG